MVAYYQNIYEYNSHSSSYKFSYGYAIYNPFYLPFNSFVIVQ